MTVDRPAGLADVTARNATLRRFLHGLPGVDQVGVEARAAALATRSIKTTAKAVRARPGRSAWSTSPRSRARTRPARCGPCAPRAAGPIPPTRRARRWPPICVYGDLVPAGGRGARRIGHPRRRRRHRVPLGPGPARRQARRRPGRGRRRRRRDRHGHRPGRLPGRALPRRARRDRRHQAGLRRRPPQGHPGDGRAGHLRQRPPGVVAGDAGGRATSSRRRPARSPPPPRCRSRW